MLSSLQRRVARLIAALPEADGFALAGGAALVVAGVVDRSTRDLDFFGPSPDDVVRLLHAVEQTLDTAGLDARREKVVHGFARLTVTDGAESTEVDLAADARIRPATEGPLGPMLSLEELAADKLLALLTVLRPASSSTSTLWLHDSGSSGSVSSPARRTPASRARCFVRCSSRSGGSALTNLASTRPLADDSANPSGGGDTCWRHSNLRPSTPATKNPGCRSDSLPARFVSEGRCLRAGLSPSAIGPLPGGLEGVECRVRGG